MINSKLKWLAVPVTAVLLAGAGCSGNGLDTYKTQIGSMDLEYNEVTFNWDIGCQGHEFILDLGEDTRLVLVDAGGDIEKEIDWKGQERQDFSDDELEIMVLIHKGKKQTYYRYWIDEDKDDVLKPMISQLFNIGDRMYQLLRQYIRMEYQQDRISRYSPDLEKVKELATELSDVIQAQDI